MWCHFRLTHRLCNGYRWETLEGALVESLCTCTCHKLGEGGGNRHLLNMIDDSERFRRARLISQQIEELEADGKPTEAAER